MTTHSDHAVYDFLRTAVVEGRLAPGARLIEQGLAEELGVSRTPVREALRRLESEGLVVIERNRGAEVRRITAAEVDDLYELRGRMESYAAELAAARRNTTQLDQLRAAAEQFERGVETMAASRAEHQTAATRELADANRWFHDTVVVAARHERLEVLLRGTVDVPLIFKALQSFDIPQLRRSALFHHLIGEAIAASDGRRAARLMAEHIAQGRDMVSETL